MGKKDFKANITPALAFISEAQEQPQDQPTREKTLYKTDYTQVEARSKRLQLLLQPSVYNKIKTKADRQGISVNELIHRILEREEA